MEQSARKVAERIVTQSDAPELRTALRDLDEAKDEAREGGFPPPSDTARRNACQLLPATHAISPQRFEVYPTPDREVTISAPDGPGRSLLLLCDCDGGALRLVNMNGAHRCARHSGASLLPDGFAREALNDLERCHCEAV